MKILWTWIHIRANSFIKTSVNIIKRTSTKVPWKLSLGKKNATPHFKEHCTKIDISLVVIRLFFSQVNLTRYLLTYWIVFCHNLFTFLSFDFYLYSTDFEVHPMQLRLFYKFWWGSMFSQGSQLRTLQPFWPKGLISSIGRYAGALYKKLFLTRPLGTIMLQTISKLKFWCNVSTNWSKCKNWFCSRKKLFWCKVEN